MSEYEKKMLENMDHIINLLKNLNDNVTDVEIAVLNKKA